MKIQLKLDKIKLLDVDYWTVYRERIFKISRGGYIKLIKEGDRYLGTAETLKDVFELCKEDFIREFGKYWKPYTKSKVKHEDKYTGKISEFTIEKEDNKVTIHISIYINLRDSLKDYHYVELRGDYRAEGELKEVKKKEIERMMEESKLSYESPDEILLRYGYIRVRGYHVRYYSKRYNKIIEYDVRPHIRRKRKW